MTTTGLPGEVGPVEVRPEDGGAAGAGLLQLPANAEEGQVLLMPGKVRVKYTPAHQSWANSSERRGQYFRETPVCQEANSRTARVSSAASKCRWY